MQFKNILFPVNISKNSIGGPEYISNILATANGKEFCQKISANTRIKYLIESGFMSYEDVQELISFFRIVEGKKYSFRFKDWTDFKAKNQILQKTASSINEYQITKLYEIDGITVERKIKHPIKQSIKIYIDDENIVPIEQYQVNENGVITFNDNTNYQNILKVSCEFDIEVRFDCDRLNFTLNSDESYSIKNIELIEIV